MDTPYNEWTSCEVYGHAFTDGVCVDCGVRAPDDDVLIPVDALKWVPTGPPSAADLERWRRENNAAVAAEEDGEVFDEPF